MCHLLLLDRSGEDFRKEVRAWRVGKGVRDKDSRRGAMVVIFCFDSASTGLQSIPGEGQARLTCLNTRTKASFKGKWQHLLKALPITRGREN